MKSTYVDRDGIVRCPKCHADMASAVSKRTGVAKVGGFATLGVGVVLMPKRLKCSGCGENLKRGNGKPSRDDRLEQQRERLAELKAQRQERKAIKAAHKALKEEQ